MNKDAMGQTMCEILHDYERVEQVDGHGRPLGRVVYVPRQGRSPLTLVARAVAAHHRPLRAAAFATLTAEFVVLIGLVATLAVS